jgi:hypothetical protein
MSASHAPALDAIAFQLAAALDTYEQDVDAMMDAPLDMDLYREVSEQVDQIRMYTAALPTLSVQWVELLIAHTELVHGLWRSHYGREKTLPGEVDAIRAHHLACIVALRSRCLRLLQRSAT